MKSRFMGSWGIAVGVGIVLATTGCVEKAVSSPEVTNAAVSTNALAAPAQAVASAQTATNAVEEGAVEKPEVDISEADYTPLTTARTVPPTVRTNGALGEILRMVDAGVEEGVLLAFVTNSGSTFSLDADEIIYLNDIGVPAAVVTAMIQQDQVLRGAALTQTNVWSQTPETAANQTPAEIAPQTTAPQAQNGAPPAPPEGTQPVPQQPQETVTYSTFYNSLSPYGTWVYIQGYGNVWQPTVVVSNPGWTPYLNNGRWIYTDAGWYWYSDYSWGWAPFHYGRWFRHYRLGWCWYPDYVWGPSWVTWRYSSGYCGWAPLPPGAWYRPGFGLTYWGSSVSVGFGFGLSYHHYAFVPWNRFHHHGLHHHHVRHGDYSRRIYHDSVVATRIHGSRYAMNDGLPASRVAAATGQPVRPVAIRATEQAGNLSGRRERLDREHNTVSVFRPAIPVHGREPQGRPATRTLVESGTRSPAATPTTVAPSRSIAANRLGGSASAPTADRAPRTWERPVAANTRSVPQVTQRAPVAPAVRSAPSGGRETAASPAAQAPTAAPDRPDIRTSQRSAFGVVPKAREPVTGENRAVTPATRPTSPSTAQVAPAPQAPQAPAAQSAPATRSAPPTGVWQRGQPQLQARNEPITRTPALNAPSTSTATRQAPAPLAPSTPQGIWQRQAAPVRPSAPAQVAPQVQTVPRPAAPAYTPPARTYSPPQPTYQPPPRVETPRYSAPAATPAPRAMPAPTPSYQAPTRSAPAHSYSAPAVRSAPAPAPAPSYSRPSNSGGNGRGGDASGFSRQSRNQP